MTCVVEIEPTNERRGMRGCPTCNRRALKLVETESHDVPADRGEIMVTRTFRCTTNGCHTTKRTLEVCAGDVTKKSVRPSAEHYGEPSEVAVETAPDRIVLKT